MFPLVDFQVYASEPAYSIANPLAIEFGFWGFLTWAFYFIINSLDSLIRLYTQNLGITMKRFGKMRYLTGNWIALTALVLLYQLTPLKIEWVGLTVVGIYLTIYWLVFQRRQRLAT